MEYKMYQIVPKKKLGKIQKNLYRYLNWHQSIPNPFALKCRSTLVLLKSRGQEGILRRGLERNSNWYIDT